MSEIITIDLKQHCDKSVDSLRTNINVYNGSTVNTIAIDLTQHPDKSVDTINGGGEVTSGVKCVNYVYPDVNGNVALSMDNIPETETRSFSKIGIKLNEIVNKLDTIAEGATKVEKSETNGNIIINGVDTSVYENCWNTF